MTVAFMQSLTEDHLELELVWVDNDKYISYK